MPETRHTRVLIVGSGPAGYTAAIYAARDATLNPAFWLVGLAGATPYLRLFATTLGGFLLARAMLAAKVDGRPEREASALFYVQHVLPSAGALLPAVKAGVAPEAAKAG